MATILHEKVSITSDTPGERNPWNAAWDIHIGAFFVVDPESGLAIQVDTMGDMKRLRDAGWKERGSRWIAPDGSEQIKRKFQPTCAERRKMEQPRPPMDPRQASARELHLPNRPMEERVVRVREDYTYALERDLLTWREYRATETATDDTHLVITVATMAGWQTVSCDCPAFDNFEERCVHCVRCDEWIKETEMAQATAPRSGQRPGNGRGNYNDNRTPEQSTDMVVSPAAERAIAVRREREAEFYNLVNNQIFGGKATPALLDYVSVYQEVNQLDVLAGQVNVIERKVNEKVGNNWVTRSVWQISPSIHGLYAIAERTGNFGGIEGEQWCGPDEVWRDIWLSDEPPAAARCIVKSLDGRVCEGKVTWSSFAPIKTEKRDIPGAFWPSGDPKKEDVIALHPEGHPRAGKPIYQALWETHKPEQLMNAAIRQAMRKCFPNERRFRIDGDKLTTSPLDPNAEPVEYVNDLRKDDKHEDIEGEFKIDPEPVRKTQAEVLMDEAVAAFNQAMARLDPAAKATWTEEGKRAFPKGLRAAAVADIDAFRGDIERSERRRQDEAAAAAKSAAPSASQQPQASAVTAQVEADEDVIEGEYGAPPPEQSAQASFADVAELDDPFADQ